MARRSAQSGPAAILRTDVGSRVWNLHYACGEPERSESRRRSGPAPSQGHSNDGSNGVERPPRLSLGSNDCGCGKTRILLISDCGPLAPSHWSLSTGSFRLFQSNIPPFRFVTFSKPTAVRMAAAVVLRTPARQT